MKKKKPLLRLLGRVAGALTAVVLLAGLYLTLVIGQPQPDGKETPPPQPALTASPAMTISSEGELRNLVAAFPAPVMSFMTGSGMVFVSGTSADAAWHGGFGRILTLYWQTMTGEPMTLQSIYPAEAFSLLGKKDYAFSGTAGPTLFGGSSVRMENAETIRVHTVTDTGLYVLTIPRSLSPALSGIARSIQLFTAE